MTNFALTDGVGILAAFLLFPVLTFFPGYLVAHVLNIWQFRERSFAFQIAVSVPLSIGIGPTLTFFIGSVSKWQVVWIFYLAIFIAALFRIRPIFDGTVRRAGLLAVAWTVFATTWLMDWQFGSRVYFPIYALDYSTRAAFIHSIAAFGLPAQTPFFHPGHAVGLHYHFLWLLQAALIHWLAPTVITARLAFMASAIWAGLGLMCVAALAMRIVFEKRSWVVIGLLAVTGLDLIPALCILVANKLHLLDTLPPSAEWWNEQVDGWVYTVLWEPHYVCALIACVIGFLLIWQTRRMALAIPAALCFATAAGSGSFVALVFAAFLTVWMLFHLSGSLTLAITGVLAVVLSLPYLATLRGPAQNAGGPAFLLFTVRHFTPLPMPWFVYLMALPLNYFLELGFFAACVLIGYRRKLDRHEWMLFTMAAVSIVICTFAKSGATPNNDLGWRGFLVAQFALLLLAAAYLETNRLGLLLKATLIVGILGTTYDLLLTRTFPILSDANQIPKLKWLALDDKLGERTLAHRQAYSWLLQNSNPTAIVAQNPNSETANIFHGLYADRTTMAGDKACIIAFGGTSAECAAIQTELVDLYAGRATIAADYCIVENTDPWPWSAPPLFQNEYVRIFSCNGSKPVAK